MRVSPAQNPSEQTATILATTANAPCSDSTPAGYISSPCLRTREYTALHADAAKRRARTKVSSDRAASPACAGRNAHRERAVDLNLILQVPPFRLGGVEVLLRRDLDRQHIVRRHLRHLVARPKTALRDIGSSPAAIRITTPCNGPLALPLPAADPSFPPTYPRKRKTPPPPSQTYLPKEALLHVLLPVDRVVYQRLVPVRPSDHPGCRPARPDNLYHPLTHPGSSHPALLSAVRCSQSAAHEAIAHDRHSRVAVVRWKQGPPYIRPEAPTIPATPTSGSPERS